VKSPVTLIHTALLSEAQPIIDALDLRQYDTRPYRIFRGSDVVLVTSGVGAENTRRALRSVLESLNVDVAVNVGIAGCSDAAIPIGSLFVESAREAHPFPDLLPSLPLISFDEPVRHLDSPESVLVDMEAAAFREVVDPVLTEGEGVVIKVVSDHLSDAVLPKKQIRRLMEENLRWIPLFIPSRSKLDGLINTKGFRLLHEDDRFSLWKASRLLRMTHQETRLLIDMALDFRQWGEPSLSQLLDPAVLQGVSPFLPVRQKWEELRNSPRTYSLPAGKPIPESRRKAPAVHEASAPLGLGRCPVASEQTRCCNLSTLDAVEGCAFDCSYCSIRSFYNPDRVNFHHDLGAKLSGLELDPDKTYHIGTGQSSDSLLWGNRDGILDALCDFADGNPNVILELKTKSDNVDHLIRRSVPPNLLCTWSLNTPVVVHHEERGTPSLEQRIQAARRAADAGILVGFHFHPIVEYEGSREDYEAVYSQVQDAFEASEVVMVSLGTLTFTKPVIKAIRESRLPTSILQMPLSEAAGKFSYSLETKTEMFSHAYRCFPKWHEEVFFYLCMEDISLWEPVFGRSYQNNDAFEGAMIGFYKEKIREKRLSHR
jgi:spore photoproduct lyase